MTPAVEPGAGTTSGGHRLGAGAPPSGGRTGAEDRFRHPMGRPRRRRHLVSRTILVLIGLVVVLGLPLVLWVSIYSLTIARLRSFGVGDPRWLLVVVPLVGLGGYVLVRYGSNAIADSILQLRRLPRPLPPLQTAASSRGLVPPLPGAPLASGLTRADPAALGTLLAGRLARVLGDGFAVIASPDGDSILLQHGDRSHVVRVPVERLALLPAGDGVTVVARHVMAETQRFATLETCRLWPEGSLRDRDDHATSRTAPRVTVSGTTVRLVWQDRRRIVARLPSFDLGEVELRSPGQAPVEPPS